MATVTFLFIITVILEIAMYRWYHKIIYKPNNILSVGCYRFMKNILWALRLAACLLSVIEIAQNDKNTMYLEVLCSFYIAVIFIIVFLTWDMKDDLDHLQNE